MTSYSMVKETGNRTQSLEVQILVSVLRSSFVKCLRTQFLPIITRFLHVTQKCGWLNAYCFLDKPKYLTDFKDVQIPIVAVLTF